MTNVLPRIGVAAPVAALLGSLLGLLVVRGFALPLVMASVAVALVTLLVRSPGWGLGVWVLAVTNTIPALNLDTLHVPGLFQPYDGLMILLFGATLLAATGLGHRELRRRLPRWLVWAVVLLSAWWLLVLLRTWLLASVPLLPAALFGRDLLYGGVATVCAAVLLPDRKSVHGALNVMIIGAAIYSVAFVPHVLVGSAAGWIVHPSLQGTSDGLLRIYQLSNDLVVAVFPVALWLTLSTRGHLRLAYACVAGLFAVQIALQQTRATYISVALSLALATAFMLARPAFRAFRPRLLALWGVVGGVLLTIGVVVTSSRGAGDTSAISNNPIYQRVALIPATLTQSVGSGSEGSWAYRVQIADRLLKILGHNYLWGVGFLNPIYHYYANLPNGSIRNSDVGALEIVMVVGVVGLVLVLAPVAGSAFGLVRSSFLAPEDLRDRALVVGLVGFLIGALLSSVTLVTLFLGARPAMSGILVACALTMSRAPAHKIAGSPADPLGSLEGEAAT